jgi:mycofactocin system transcriptional regulator
VTGVTRRGRPPATSRRELRLIALRLFAEQGFDATTIEQIAAEAGVSERTFFRYFTTKANVLWDDFETEVEAIRAALAATGDDVPMMSAIREAVVAANHYHADDVPELQMRMQLIATVPALQFSASEHYEAWERAVSEFAGRRLGQPAESLFPLTVGRAVLAACRAAYERWSVRADNDLTIYLNAALSALAAGFDAEAVRQATAAPASELTVQHHVAHEGRQRGGRAFVVGRAVAGRDSGERAGNRALLGVDRDVAT